MTDARTAGEMTRIPAADPRTTGGLTRVRDDVTTGGLTAVGTKPPRRRRKTFVATIASVVVLAALVVGGVVLLDRRSGNDPAKSGGATAQPSANASAIANRTVDPSLLTVAEVFGATTVKSSAPGGTYHVVKSEAENSCADAATAAVRTLLTSLGCNQAIRATMTSPDQTYVVTAGVVNLPTATAATKAAASLQADIASGKGRFNGLAAGGVTDAITAAQARVAWDTRGHYLIYSVIALATGKPIAANDDRVPLIITDVVENYLGDTVLAAREQATAPQPAGS